MRKNFKRSFLALLLVGLMVGSSVAGILGSADDGGDLVGGGIGLFDVGPWVDDFNDESLIEVKQNTEVISGEIHLVTGQTAGLIASKEIAPPEGYKFDLLLLEVDTPGLSSVFVSVLNASEASSTVGYVNQPIPGFLKLDRTQVPLSSISLQVYPEIRLQADLESAGAERPSLLKWTVFFISKEMWRDEFLGDGKIESQLKVNLTGDTVELNMSMQNLFSFGYGKHDDYPPIFVNRGGSGNYLQMGIIYPNAARTGYQGRTQIDAQNAAGFVAGDIDSDGFIDVVVGNLRDGSDYTVDSYILWGDASGTWAAARRANLATEGGRWPALGDVDGDGQLDVLIANGGGSGQVRVWLNPGSRTFSNTHDIALPGQDINGLASADLNNDGYDDAVLAENYDSGGKTYSRAYFGGPGGPDTTADKSYETGACHDVEINDFDGDTNADIAFACNLEIGGNDRARVFYGGEDGPDETYDFAPDVTYSDQQMSVGSGYLNGDDRIDLVFGRYGSGPRLFLFYGRAGGYTNNAGDREDPPIGSSARDIVVIDVDNDGYDDVVAGTYYQDRVDIYKGAAGGVDGTSDIRINNVDKVNAIGVGVGRQKATSIVGSFITTPITRSMDMKWDVLVAEGNTPPETEIEITVLDSGLQPILGYESLTGPDVDLSGITIPTIHIKVTMKSFDMVTTPSMDMIFVKWMDKNAWREEFWGHAKIGSVMGFDVMNYQLGPDPSLGGSKELIFSNLRNDGSYNVPSFAYSDAGGMDYLSQPPLRYRIPSGPGAVKAGDFNSDGFTDLIFAVLQTSDNNYIADSPMFLGSAVGWQTIPDKKFPTIGASDVVITDLNEDGHTDVVFAQEQDGTTYEINSTLFWGSATGWNATPDVEFVTTGASKVIAVDVDGNGLDDLVFANYKDESTTAVDSQVYLQTATGFDGTTPDHSLATRGARSVAAGDIDEDTHVDLVFANSFAGGFADIDSYVYWGRASGGFEPAPRGLLTHGASDVELADINGDGDLDVVFANSLNNAGAWDVNSTVFFGSASRSIDTTPDVELPTLGASAVEVTDLDGTGRPDLVFANQYNGATYEINSYVYLGGATGYGASPPRTSRCLPWGPRTWP
jgi:hypothetical protein